jgi:hypothetical protein
VPLLLIGRIIPSFCHQLVRSQTTKTLNLELKYYSHRTQKVFPSLQPQQNPDVRSFPRLRQGGIDDGVPVEAMLAVASL